MDLVLPRTRCIECVVAGVNTTWVRYVYKIRDLLQTQQVSCKNETFLWVPARFFLETQGIAWLGVVFGDANLTRALEHKNQGECTLTLKFLSEFGDERHVAKVE